jgi:hypothetical protein
VLGGGGLRRGRALTLHPESNSEPNKDQTWRLIASKFCNNSYGYKKVTRA